jgi:hypothetical protein
MDIDLTRADVDALATELDAERYRHVAGLEPAPSLAPIFRAHHRAAHRETAAELERAGDRGLAARVAALRVERAQAEDEEAWRAAEAEASAAGPDGPVALGDALLAVTRERVRERRLAFGRAAAAASSIAAREAALEKRARARAEVGLVPDWEKVVQGDALLAASDDGYRDVLAWLARREVELALPPEGDLSRADLLFALALHGWEGHFPRGMLALALERAGAPLGLRLDLVRVDDGSRRAQWPGAHAVGARVSLRRQGGPADWLGLFEAVGAALAAAAAPAHRRHPAAPATCGALLASLLLDAGFLAARLDVDRKRAPDLVRALALRQLFRLRARAGALRVASELERGTTGSAWYEAHREAMALAALASWPHGLAARDGDGTAARAALEGAARAEALRRALVERCDVDWWRNPRSAEVVAGVLAAGGEWAGDEPPLALAAEGLLAKMQ